MKVYLAIDPGKDGGVVVYIPETRTLYKWVMPQSGSGSKTVFDKVGYSDLLHKIKTKFPNVIAIIEEIHSIFGVAASSNWKLGNVFGMQEMGLIANKIPYHLVPPKTWQAQVWSHSDKVMVLKKGNKKETTDTKTTSLRAFKRIFPNEDFRSSPRSLNFHDGMVDAALMCEAARRMNF